jgi:hypothetical protein
VLGTVAWTVVANRALHARTTAAYQHALAAGFDRAFLVSAGITLLLVVAVVTLVRDRRVGLGGAGLGGADLARESGGRAAHHVEQAGQSLPDAPA